MSMASSAELHQMTNGQGIETDVTSRFSREAVTLDDVLLAPGYTEKLPSQIDIRLNRIDIRLNGIDIRPNGIDIRLNGTDIRLNGIDIRLNRIDIRLNGIDIRLNEIAI